MNTSGRAKRNGKCQLPIRSPTLTGSRTQGLAQEPIPVSSASSSDSSQADEDPSAEDPFDKRPNGWTAVNASSHLPTTPTSYGMFSNSKTPGKRAAYGNSSTPKRRLVKKRDMNGEAFDEEHNSVVVPEHSSSPAVANSPELVEKSLDDELFLTHYLRHFTETPSPAEPENNDSLFIAHLSPAVDNTRGKRNNNVSESEGPASLPTNDTINVHVNATAYLNDDKIYEGLEDAKKEQVKLYLGLKAKRKSHAEQAAKLASIEAKHEAAEKALIKQRDDAIRKIADDAEKRLEQMKNDLAAEREGIVGKGLERKEDASGRLHDFEIAGEDHEAAEQQMVSLERSGGFAFGLAVAMVQAKLDQMGRVEG
ncbi:hypothetical protein BS50DRAFT_651015 [Corynespora cassiicola Philippines]|uniref:Uncharacterized protein n=1 Tax=Corynespora cassiicola Philippines TaxID=1448308 RepID=A0A2T2N882_CORCC|nr:hypothetical protein BS50DRAFT_651015 [Corynespora cassiicola Philippines]